MIVWTSLACALAHSRIHPEMAMEVTGVPRELDLTGRRIFAADFTATDHWGLVNPCSDLERFTKIYTSRISCSTLIIHTLAHFGHSLAHVSTRILPFRLKREVFSTSRVNKGYHGSCCSHHGMVIPWTCSA